MIRTTEFKFGYRPGVGIMVLKNASKVWIGQRFDRHTSVKTDLYWQMPQGGLDEGEDPLIGAQRELYEETGIQNTELIGQTSFYYSYDFPESTPLVFESGIFQGQCQQWFAFHFKGEDKNININTLKPEFWCWQWMDITKISQVVVPFKKAVYEAVIQDLTPQIKDFYKL